MALSDPISDWLDLSDPSSDWLTLSDPIWTKIKSRVIISSAFIAMDPDLVVITRIGSIVTNTEEIITRFLT